VKLRRRANAERRGAILVIVALVVIFAAMGAVLMTMNAASSNQRAETERHSTRARFLARGALEVVQQLVADRFFRTNATQASTSYLIESFDQVKGLFDETNVAKIGEHEVTYQIRELDDPTAGKTTDGLNAFLLPIEIRTDASVPGAKATARRMVVLTFVPVYQFAAFFDMDLEIWPGPAMVLNGPVHTNGNLYVGADTSITFDTNYIHAAGSFYQSRAYAPIPNAKPVMIRRWVDDPNSSSTPAEYVQLPTKDQMAADGILTTNGMDSLFPGFDRDGDGLFLSAGDQKPFGSAAVELFKTSSSSSSATLQTGEHGVKSIALPQMSSKAPFVATEPGTGGWDYDPKTGEYSASADGDYVRGPYHEQAGLKILLAPDGTWTAVDGNGIDVTARLGGVVHLGSVADVREKNDVKVAEIDMRALAASGEFPPNGLLYLAAVGDTPKDGSRGFLVKHGAELAEYSVEPRDASAYDPPNRHWAYDTSFNDFDSLPPFTPFLLQFAAAAEY